MQSKEIDKNIFIQRINQDKYRLTKMTFTDGTTVFGHFWSYKQTTELKLKNKWVFYYADIRVILDGRNISSVEDIYTLYKEGVSVSHHVVQSLAR